MAGIFGSVVPADSSRIFEQTVGQQVIWDEVQNYLTRVNTDLNNALAVFLEGDTEKFKYRYKLPGGGSLQKRGSNGSYGTIKTAGQWDIALPLEDFGAQVAGNDVDMAYMTPNDLEVLILTAVAQNVSTTRYELLRALLNNTQRLFPDERNGDLQVMPLANNDAVLYPPVLGSESEAVENHYLVSGYAPGSISDSNNPIPVIVNELEEHFGSPTGGSNIAVFFNNTHTSKFAALSDFNDDGLDSMVIPGLTQNVLTGLPMNVPGKLVGRSDGAWLIEWRNLPANYLVGIHLGVPKPVMRRNDPADTGLVRGLQLVAVNERFPFQSSFFRNRFGIGVGNRLNGVIMFLDAGSTYTVPAGY